MKILFSTNTIYSQSKYNNSFKGNLKDNKKNRGTKIPKPDLLECPPEKIIKTIKTAIKKEENKIGNGGEATVWRIPNSHYCVRIPCNEIISNNLNFSKDLTKSDKTNHTVAKFNNGITIMPIIDGYTFCSDKIKDEEVAKMIEDMPVESYKNLILQALKAETETELVFDNGWKNIIINPAIKKMTAIDFYKTKDRDIFSNIILSNIYSSLVNNPCTSTEQKQKCAGKIILATISILDNEGKGIKALGFDKFITVLTEHNLFENNNYAKILRNNFKKLKNRNSEESIGAKKILVQLCSQLFNVK